MRQIANIFIAVFLLIQFAVPHQAAAIFAAPNFSIPVQLEKIPKQSFSEDQAGETEADYETRFHPDGQLYIGDVISIEVIAPPGENLDGHNVQVRADGADSEVLGSAEFGSFGIGRRSQATLTWIWDTSGLEPGWHSLTFSVLPSGAHWTEAVSLLPANDLGGDDQAEWSRAENECCVVYYITGTEAERDLSKILEKIDDQADQAAEAIGGRVDQPVTITLLPRVLGHGGFASSEISLSYLDRNYMGGDFELVVHHEMIHILDSRLGGEFRPTMLVEGLAVYLSGGHFKKEDLLPRAAALLQLPDKEQRGASWYLPLAPLADNFYGSQHEIGYMEAAALIEYMVQRWGWEAFSNFYRDIHPSDGGRHSAAIDMALQEHFNLSFNGLEADFIAELSQQPVTPEQVDDVRLTVNFFDTARRYQGLLDPSAYFRTAWLLDNEEMRKRSIVDDYLRHPEQPRNMIAEVLLLSASQHIEAGNYLEAQAILESLNKALDHFAPVQESEVGVFQGSQE